MDSRFDRIARLRGLSAVERLAQARVIVFGLGGVGSWAVEALARNGVGEMTLVDADVVTLTNINRQLPALSSTLGQPKVDVMGRRVLDINPACRLTLCPERFEASDPQRWHLDDYDCVIDAIDSLSDKAALILEATRRGSRCRLFSSMGAALRTNPLAVTVSRFDRVTGDRLAAALRQRFRRLGRRPDRNFTCVWSTEQIRPLPLDIPSAFADGSQTYGHRTINGADCCVTATFGLNLASASIAALTSEKSR